MTLGFLKNCWSRISPGSKTQEQYDYDADLEMSEAEKMEIEFLADAVNRSVLVVRPAEPFKRWAAKTGRQ